MIEEEAVICPACGGVNPKYAYSEKRGELDYEISVRSYRKLIELEKRLEQFTEPHSEEK